MPARATAGLLVALAALAGTAHGTALAKGAVQIDLPPSPGGNNAAERDVTANSATTTTTTSTTTTTTMPMCSLPPPIVSGCAGLTLSKTTAAPGEQLSVAVDVTFNGAACGTSASIVCGNLVSVDGVPTTESPPLGAGHHTAVFTAPSCPSCPMCPVNGYGEATGCCSVVPPCCVTGNNWETCSSYIINGLFLVDDGFPLCQCQPATDQLSATIAATPPDAMVGDQLTVTLTAANTGMTTLMDVAPASPLAVSGDGMVALASGPTPASVTLAPGAHQDFVYTYDTTHAGMVVFQGMVQGTGASGVVTATAQCSVGALDQTRAAASVCVIGGGVQVRIGICTIDDVSRGVLVDQLRGTKTPPEGGT